MGRELQKKKNRSSISKVKMKPKSKRVNPLGNAIVAANWDSTQTLSQNYRRLGLTSRLNSATGGTEVAASKTSTAAKLAIHTSEPTALHPTEARVERDAVTGKIVRVIHAGTRKANPLNDQLLSDDSDLDDADEHENNKRNETAREEGSKGRSTEDPKARQIIRELELQASMVPEKKVRKQSQREQEWIERLVGRYGEDFKGMARDRRLNPMQQTETDIRRRVGRWRGEGGVITAAEA